ncbi:UNVERIFIED_CONTAM: hypothetical protein Slati_1278800 [Sesamum latifolium]|uniref:TBCC domain-containing protein 1 n=1 Tax=Sesamum latifolium TaxID=2727402 RepID=A0AAW2XG96_9LAMI
MTDSPAAEQQPEPPPPSTPTAAYHLHPRREPFEHGLLPIPKLIFTDGTQTLSLLKSTLLSSSSNYRVSSETLSRVFKSPLNIRSYKRLLPKGHKDSAAVADVWPSTSAFDGFLSALSPLQLVRSNSRRSMPSQADEEAHQLSYLQKHLGNILSLLADSAEAEGDESLVLSMDKFEHLGFLIYFGERGSERIPLSQNTPFFANSDPDMPAVPVPASHVLDWLLQHISSTLEHLADRVSPKENGPSSSSDQDVTMADVGTSSVKPSSSTRGPSFIEGISKSSYIKHLILRGHLVKFAQELIFCVFDLFAQVVNCHESVIYILAPLRYATVYGCSDATIVLGAVGKAVRVEHCERVHLITASRRVCIVNCRECLFFLGVNQQPLMVGDNHKLQVAPFNTFYSQLEEHMNQVGVDPNINRWDEPVALGFDPHDSLSHPAGVSDVQTESATRLDPDQYTNFVIPNWLGSDQAGSTKDNPFPLPDAYLASQQKNHKNLVEVKQILRETQLEESRKRELSTAVHACFKDWLYVQVNGVEKLLVAAKFVNASS